MSTTVEKPVEQGATAIQPWMAKIVRRQMALNKRYEKARSQFASAWNDFLAALEEINGVYGTDFSVEQAITEFEGQYSDEADEDEDDDEDEE